jgi:hypothetical protein
VREIDFDVPAERESEDVIAAVERACAAEGLTQTLRGTLRAYPGCVHWHFKNGAARGVLEITWWPKTRRLWVKVASGREAAWIDGVVERVKGRV